MAFLPGPHPSLRFSEKSFVMNFVSEYRPARGRAIWWGLTQAEERRLGFDARVFEGGRGFLLQFKAVHDTTPAVARFHAEHEQMRILASHAVLPQTVFYALTTVASWQDFVSQGLRVIPGAWLLDISRIPRPLRRPMTLTRPFRRRRSGVHYIELHPPMAVIRSEPVEVPVIPAEMLIGMGLEGREAGDADLERFSFTARSLRGSRWRRGRWNGLAALIITNE
jgi:hypothetical protein